MMTSRQRSLEGSRLGNAVSAERRTAERLEGLAYARRWRLERGGGTEFGTERWRTYVQAFRTGEADR